MVRRYEDPVHVRPGDEGAAGPEPPSSFLWRGRVYVVRAVLGHWRERRAWWTDTAARAVHGDDGPPGGAPPADLGSSGSPPREVPSPGTRLSLSDEREVWRVEAGCGRAAGLGVYDLCHDPGRAWSLVRVSD